ncbi:MAG TPA: SRPBCC family protein [Gaiellaceae bacterium]|nr:SRPBCC family protein [Gaiellaceae bacterium]
MPRYAAERVLLAPIEDVWAFVAEPYHLTDWWPGISGVVPDRRGMAAGARWTVQGPSYMRKPEAPAVLLVRAVVARERFSFELPSERLGVEVLLRPERADRTRVSVAVEGRFVIGPRRRIAADAVNRLYDLVQTAAGL